MSRTEWQEGPQRLPNISNVNGKNGRRTSWSHPLLWGPDTWNPFSKSHNWRKNHIIINSQPQVPLSFRRLIPLMVHRLQCPSAASEYLNRADCFPCNMPCSIQWKLNSYTYYSKVICLSHGILLTLPTSNSWSEEIQNVKQCQTKWAKSTVESDHFFYGPPQIAKSKPVGQFKNDNHFSITCQGTSQRSSCLMTMHAVGIIILILRS